jgi:pimeloyl-ACP methyl ester carboxylesterase
MTTGEGRPMTYDEFSLLRQNTDEAGLPWHGQPAVERVSVNVGGDQRVSALRWGKGTPQLVLLHGGAQNAHTWDTVALALGVPLLAIDLPGHGHSDWREDRDYWPLRNAEAVAAVMRELVPAGAPVVGMSLGGLTAIRLAAVSPELVVSLVVVDVTPGVDMVKSAPIVDFVQGPESFADFDELLGRTVQHNPTRSVSSLRRGLLHNARPREDGRWVWRYDRLRPPGDSLDFGYLWEDLERIEAPIMLVLGADSGVVVAEDVAEFTKRQQATKVVTVPGAGHSIQGDQPLRLAELITEFR